MILFQIMRRINLVFQLGFLKVLMWALILNALFGTLFFLAEREAQEISFLDALWWAMVTMTTVGYGDFYAQTFVGRFLVSYPCMFLGIGVMGYLVGVVANHLIDWASKKRKGEMEIRYNGHIIICNFPGVEKVLNIVRELRAAQGLDEVRFVLVTEVLEELPPKLSNEGIAFVKGSPTDEEVLHRANILESLGTIVLSMDPGDVNSDDRTYAVSSIIELIEDEKKISLKTVAELASSRNARNFSRAAVDGVVSTDGVAGCLIAQEFLYPGVGRIINEMISNTRGSQLYLHRTELVGHPIVDLQKAVLEHEADIQVIGLFRDGDCTLNPAKSLRIQPGDTLIVLAENAHDIGAIERDIMERK